MKRFEYHEVQPRNEVQVQTEVQVQPSRPLTKEEYELYNALPLWLIKCAAMERAQRRNVRKVL